MKKERFIHVKPIYLIAGLIALLFIVIGSVYLSKKASDDTDEAVRKVSHLYLDELSGRREQVVENNLKSKFDDMQVNAEIMTMVLEMKNMQVEHAQNGRIALTKFEESEPSKH